MAEASVSVRVVCRFRPPLLNARAEKLAQASKEKEKDSKEKTATPDTKCISPSPYPHPPSSPTAQHCTDGLTRSCLFGV